MKKILSVVIAISMLLGMMIPMGITASAAAATECATWAEVVAAVEADSAASIKLTNHVTANSTIASFAGTFDGNDYTVTVEKTMFAEVTGTATLKNFQTAAAAAITVAPIVNLLKGDATVVIENVVNNVDVAESTEQMGGIIAKTSGTVSLTMTSCVNNGNLQTLNQASGIVGNADGTLTVDFTDVVNNGNITGNQNYAAGILCTNGGVEGTMTRVVNNGNIVIESKKANNKGSNGAGIIGTAKGKTIVTLTECVNTGDVTLITENTSAHYGVSAFATRTDNESSVFTLANCVSTGVMTSATAGTTADAIAVPAKKGAASATNTSYVNGETTVAGATKVDAAVAEAAIDAIKAKMTLPTFDANKAPETDTPAGDTPDFSKRFSYVYETQYGKAVIDGPLYMTVGSEDAITVTFTGPSLYALGAGFSSSDTSVIEFNGLATCVTDPVVNWTDSTPEAPINKLPSASCGTSVDIDPFTKAVITVPIAALKAGSSVIELDEDNGLRLFHMDTIDFVDVKVEDGVSIGYTITVVDENADEPTEPIVVDTVNVNGYVEPTVGASIADSLAGLSVSEGAPYSIVDAYWFNNDTLEIATEETFAAGGMYCLHVRLALADGYTIDIEGCVFSIDGEVELVAFASANYDETVDCDFLIGSITTTLPAEGGEGGDETTTINTIGINGFAKPTEGASVAENIAALQAAGEGYTISAAWYTFGDEPAGDTFGAGSYYLRVAITANEGYVIADNATFTINGGANDDLIDTNSTVYEGGASALLDTIYITVEGEGGEGGDEPTTPDGTEENPFVIQNKGDVDAILVPAGETYYFIIDPFNYYDTVGEDFIGNLIKVIGAGATINGNATLDLPTNGRMGWPVLFSITAGTEDARAEIVVPKGTFNNPDSFDADGKAEVSLTSPKNDFEPYIFTFKADKNGILVVTAPDGTVVTINNLTSYSYGDMGVNTAEVVAGDEIQIIIATEGADAAGTVSVTIVPHLNIAVWTKNGDWVTADELAAMKADFIAYLENEFDIDTSVLGIEWAELTTDGNKVADLGALVNAGDFDIIVGCGNNVDSTAGVTIVKKDDINTDYVAAGRKVALLDENNALAEYLYDLLTYVAPVEIDKADISGYVDPVYGQTVADYLETFIPKLPDGANYSINAISVTEVDLDAMKVIKLLESTDTFDPTKTYAISIILEANDGYAFASNAVITVNGGEVELLETMAEGSYAGAAIAFAPAASIEIDKIDVSGITAPEYGKTVADYKASFVPKLPEGANYSVVMILWFELDPETMEGNGVLADDYVFDSSKTYGFGLGIEANDGYTFADGAVITANGGALELYASMAEGPEAALALVFNPDEGGDEPTVPTEKIEIDKIDVSGITAPEYGKTVGDYKASFVPKLPEGANYDVIDIDWFELDPETLDSTTYAPLADDYVFDSSKTYGFQLTVISDEGYEFADDAVITANGGATEIFFSIVDESEVLLGIVFNPAPTTGDNSAIAIFAIAAVATVGCVAIALRKKKED